MSEKIKHLLFDADGVMLHHSERRFFDWYIDEYAIDKASVVDFFNNVWPAILVGKKDIKQELSKQLKVWHWQGTPEELMHAWYAYEYVANEPLIDYIAWLKEIGVASSLATNNDQYRARAMFDFLIRDGAVLDRLYSAGEIGTAKPSKGFFEHVMTDLDDLQKYEVLFWDDTLANVEAARGFGLKAQVYKTFDEFKEAMKFYV